MNRDRRTDLSVIIVNYNVAPLVLQAVASLQAQKFAGQDGAEGRLEVLVVDNGSSREDLACLEALPSTATLLRNGRNLGFAAANNRGIERAAGRYLCFLNPDTRVQDGALDALLQHCYGHREVGAVGPKIWADDERTLLLPPADSPTLSFVLAQIAGRAVPVLGRLHARRWRDRALTFWRSRAARSVAMLSGACLLSPRSVVERVGGFDERYFLYYEDADWCRRVGRAGYGLAYVPAAEIVHFYNQSAKLDPGSAGRHASDSRARFVEVHYGAAGTLLYGAALAVSRRVHLARPRVLERGVIDLGRIMDPPPLAVDGAAPFRSCLVELAYDRLFVPSVGAFVDGGAFQLSRPVWERLQRGRYFARMIDLETLTPLALWSWEKG